MLQMIEKWNKGKLYHAILDMKRQINIEKTKIN